MKEPVFIKQVRKMNTERQKNFIIKLAYILVIAALIFVILKYVIPLFMPFIIGFFIALILKPIINFISKKIKIKRVKISAVVLIVFYLLFFLIISMFGVKIYTYTKEMFYNLPQFYVNTIEPVLNDVVIWLRKTAPQMDIWIANSFESINDSILSFVKSMSSTVMKAIMSVAGGIPSFFIRFLFTIVASFFFTIDYSKITKFILMQFSEKNQNIILNVKKNGVDTIFKFIRAYAILIMITFIELSIGLTILKIPNSILFAALIAIIDILPILGTGGVLLPWAAICIITGNVGLAIGLVVLYLVVLVIRQTLEPKVVGNQIGLHPLVTLMCMFVGAQLFGFIGLFLLPILVTILKNMNDEGVIHLFKY
ncbi:sporulation integral membrane protein [Clostridium pasteurianum DSM 525 = ATCC 6013]|uniref:Sporulation integral membrane protein n=1 Tax=Clostridium pasteurianum DSM 525 = ATCC 6013 TaxID=1262449 RepID=A0A0H3J4N0_CLOPA|nr:sporulation integral membrane protein YtvI [Clostridium pasteurianum]AJA48449.1 sporulation integral membrane protein [Clostridium pasteurianum DSM 525 = ATCC 6013]AJA52437.1 sporulation integral membrane protein [Clostridium pasteurianum DSM 525 = ATCC 6013]KRU11553.1 sporulation integral membrane protein YtvI [Clostridium pasteurianum DSM 525 = ATCC 6013]UZW12713.1 sporulation integral membrane protein YtvI [Clostridium pasteurianum]